MQSCITANLLNKNNSSKRPLDAGWRKGPFCHFELHPAVILYPHLVVILYPHPDVILNAVKNLIGRALFIDSSAIASE